MCPGWCWACSIQSAFCTPNGYARRAGSHPYVKDDRSTVQMVLCTFSGPLPRRTEDRIYWHRPNPQERQSLHVDQASPGTAVNEEGYSEWLVMQCGLLAPTAEGNIKKGAKMEPKRPKEA